VAAHCITALELALFLAALDTAGGARRGDRIEHGGVITAAAIAEIAAAGLTVVSNPGFVHDRGDRYLSQVAVADHPDLYRARSLQAAGIPLAAGSDTPYASFDPWLGMRAARDRLTRDGHRLAPDERIPATAALGLYLGSASDPGGPPRRVAPGEQADLVFCEGCPEDILNDLSSERVALTMIKGRIVFSRDAAA
jgi:predicted amidohydrolase YtcJ